MLRKRFEVNALLPGRNLLGESGSYCGTGRPVFDPFGSNALSGWKDPSHDLPTTPVRHLEQAMELVEALLVAEKRLSINLRSAELSSLFGCELGGFTHF